MIAAQAAPVTYCYRVCGLDVMTPVELSSGAPRVSGENGADVHIARMAVPESLPDAGFRGPTWETSARAILLRIPSIARLLMHEGREISYELAAGASESLLPLFLTGSALGAILHQRGEYVLHASAIEVDGGAMIFCGQSGAGKSSLVAALCAAGFPLLADDVCRVQFGRRGAVVIPDGRRLKLWRDTIAHLGLEAYQREQIRGGIEKYWVEPPSVASDPLPLRAVFLLHTANEYSLRRTSLVHAVEHLRAFAYRPRLVKALGQEPLWLNRSTVLASQAPVYQLDRQWSLDQLGLGVKLLQEAWSRL